MWDWENPPLPIQRVEIPNTGFMRDQPTNAYILGTDRVVIIDPGSEPGVERIPKALLDRGSPEVQAIFLTHAHPDHAISARALRQVLDVPVMLHPGNAPIMSTHISNDDVDIDVDPSSPLVVDGTRYDLILTPGHAPGHIALFEAATGVMIAGDLVSGHGTIGVFPPNGSMIEYIDSLRRAKALNPSVLLPGHGPVIDDAPALFDHYLERRLGRERQILELIANGGATINDILPVLYPDLLPEYSYPAESTILAHLQKLEYEGKAIPEEGDPRKVCWRET
ncbi:MAG: MBL fold metallo-hydrolase [Thermomicrobiaceae bacterium]